MNHELMSISTAAHTQRMSEQGWALLFRRCSPRSHRCSCLWMQLFLQGPCGNKMRCSLDLLLSVVRQPLMQVVRATTISCANARHSTGCSHADGVLGKVKYNNLLPPQFAWRHHGSPLELVELRQLDLGDFSRFQRSFRGRKLGYCLCLR